MSWWTKKDTFSQIKGVSKETKKALKTLEDVKSVFNKKVNLAQKKFENKKITKFYLNSIHKSIIEIYSSFKISEKLIEEINVEDSKILKELDLLIKSEQEKPIYERQFFSRTEPGRVELIRILREYLLILQKQKIYLDKAISSERIVDNFFYEFEQYLKEEARLLGLEKNILFLYKKDLTKLAVDQTELKYYFVGYGSLMNANEIMGELKSTVGKAYETGKESVVKDWEFEFKKRVQAVNVHHFKRIFNKIATRGRWETSEDKIEGRVGVLNIEPHIGSYFNGVAIKVTQKEYDAILERENGYGVVKLKHVTDYKTGKKIKGTCVAVMSERYKSDVPKEKEELRKYLAVARRTYEIGQNPDLLIRNDIMPIPHYITTIQEGVRQLDRLLNIKDMENTYNETTFMYYKDKYLNVSFGIINLKQYFNLLERRKTVIGKMYREAIKEKSAIKVKKLFKELTGEEF